MQPYGRFISRLGVVAVIAVALTTMVLAAGSTSVPLLLEPALQAPGSAGALPPDEEKRFADAWAQQPRIDLGVPAGGAKVVIVKFNDWLCGGCKQWHEVYQPIIDKFEKESPGAVKLVMKDWPWNDRCNFNVSRPLPGHEGACEAAVAVRLARDRGKEHDMIAWLFAEQMRLINLRESANAAGAEIKTKATSLLALKPGEFEREYPARLAAIRQDVSNGVALKIEVTPTYYVNGVKTTAPVTAQGGGNNLPPDYFEAALRLELKKPAGK
jgi:protein-disulfide isomerase